MHLVDFPPFFTKETTFVISVCFPPQPAPSEKGTTPKRKNLLPRGANSFLLELTLLRKEAK